jgi:low affinity Fe/Cu permease
METNQKIRRTVAMNKTVTIDKTAQKEMKESLEAYKKDINSAKEFYPCTQELTLWLQKRDK